MVRDCDSLSNCLISLVMVNVIQMSLYNVKGVTCRVNSSPQVFLSLEHFSLFQLFFVLWPTTLRFWSSLTALAVCPAAGDKTTTCTAPHSRKTHLEVTLVKHLAVKSQIFDSDVGVDQTRAQNKHWTYLLDINMLMVFCVCWVCN